MKDKKFEDINNDLRFLTKLNMNQLATSLNLTTEFSDNGTDESRRISTFIGGTSDIVNSIKNDQENNILNLLKQLKHNFSSIKSKWLNR